MSAKHTPGPWFSPIRSFGTIYVEAHIGGGLLQEVAACCPTEQPLQQKANARLIAAAPEMLDALIIAYTALEYVSEYAIPLTTHEKVKSSIEHATGKPIDEVIK